jgi:hypothetical protein
MHELSSRRQATSFARPVDRLVNTRICINSSFQGSRRKKRESETKYDREKGVGDT